MRKGRGKWDGGWAAELSSQPPPLGIHGGSCGSWAPGVSALPRAEAHLESSSPAGGSFIVASAAAAAATASALPRRHRRMREKQKAMGRSSGGETDVAAALRPQLSLRAGVGRGAGPREGRHQSAAASAPGVPVHRRSAPLDPSGMTDSGADSGPAPTRRVAAQPPPAVTPRSGACWEL